MDCDVYFWDGTSHRHGFGIDISNPKSFIYVGYNLRNNILNNNNNVRFHYVKKSMKNSIKLNYILVGIRNPAILYFILRIMY